MTYTLHPEAEADLRDAAEFYRERAGNTLSRSLLEEFEHSVNLLFAVSRDRLTLAQRHSPFRNEAVPVFDHILGIRRRDSHPGSRAPQPSSRLLAEEKIASRTKAIQTKAPASVSARTKPFGPSPHFFTPSAGPEPGDAMWLDFESHRASDLLLGPGFQMACKKGRHPHSIDDGCLVDFAEQYSSNPVLP